MRGAGEFVNHFRKGPRVVPISYHCNLLHPSHKPCQFDVDRRGRRPNPVEAGEADPCAPEYLPNSQVLCSSESPHHDLSNVESIELVLYNCFIFLTLELRIR